MIKPYQTHEHPRVSQHSIWYTNNLQLPSHSRTCSFERPRSISTSVRCRPRHSGSCEGCSGLVSSISHNLEKIHSDSHTLTHTHTLCFDMRGNLCSRASKCLQGKIVGLSIRERSESHERVVLAIECQSPKPPSGAAAMIRELKDSS